MKDCDIIYDGRKLSVAALKDFLDKGVTPEGWEAKDLAGLRHAFDAWQKENGMAAKKRTEGVETRAAQASPEVSPEVVLETEPESDSSGIDTLFSLATTPEELYKDQYTGNVDPASFEKFLEELNTPPAGHPEDAHWSWQRGLERAIEEALENDQEYQKLLNETLDAMIAENDSLDGKIPYTADISKARKNSLLALQERTDQVVNGVYAMMPTSYLETLTAHTSGIHGPGIRWAAIATTAGKKRIVEFSNGKIIHPQPGDLPKYWLGRATETSIYLPDAEREWLKRADRIRRKEEVSPELLPEIGNGRPGITEPGTYAFFVPPNVDNIKEGWNYPVANLPPYMLIGQIVEIIPGLSEAMLGAVYKKIGGARRGSHNPQPGDTLVVVKVVAPGQEGTLQVHGNLSIGQVGKEVETALGNIAKINKNRLQKVARTPYSLEIYEFRKREPETVEDPQGHLAGAATKLASLARSSGESHEGASPGAGARGTSEEVQALKELGLPSFDWTGLDDWVKKNRLDVPSSEHTVAFDETNQRVVKTLKAKAPATSTLFEYFSDHVFNEAIFGVETRLEGLAEDPNGDVLIVISQPFYTGWHPVDDAEVKEKLTGLGLARSGHAAFDISEELSVWDLKPANVILAENGDVIPFDGHYYTDSVDLRIKLLANLLGGDTNLSIASDLDRAYLAALADGDFQTAYDLLRKNGLVQEKLSDEAVDSGAFVRRDGDRIVPPSELSRQEGISGGYQFTVVPSVPRDLLPDHLRPLVGMMERGEITELRKISAGALKHALSDMEAITVDLNQVSSGAGAPAVRINISVKRNHPDPESVMDRARSRILDLAGIFHQPRLHEIEFLDPSDVPLGAEVSPGAFNRPYVRVKVPDGLLTEINEIKNELGFDSTQFDGQTLLVYATGKDDPDDFFARTTTFVQKVNQAYDRKRVDGKDRGVERGTLALRDYAVRSEPDHGIIGYEDYQLRDGRSREGERLRATLIADLAAYLGRGVTVPQGRTLFTRLTPEQIRLQTAIADYFEAAPDNDLDNPNGYTKRAYDALVGEILDQWDAVIAKHPDVQIELVDWNRTDPVTGEAISGEPYGSSHDVVADIRNNQHLYVLATNKDAFGPPGVDFSFLPLLQDSGRVDANGRPLLMNDIFRAVHDYIAHGLYASSFGPIGEEAAYLAHAATIKNPWALAALAVETRGQNSWVNYGPQMRQDGQFVADLIPITERKFARQKAFLLPREMLFTGDPVVDDMIRQLPADLGSIATNFSTGISRDDLPSTAAKPLPKGQQRLVELLRSTATRFTGRLYHGAPLPKMYDELRYDSVYSAIHELDEPDGTLASTSLNEGVASRHFGGTGGNVIEFQADGIEVVKIPDWLLGVLSKETGAGWYDDYADEINEMAPQYDLPKNARGEYYLPSGWLSKNVGADAYTLLDSLDADAYAGNQEAEISVDYGIIGGKSLTIKAITIDGETFETPAEAIAYIEANHDVESAEFEAMFSTAGPDDLRLSSEQIADLKRAKAAAQTGPRMIGPAIAAQQRVDEPVILEVSDIPPNVLSSFSDEGMEPEIVEPSDLKPVQVAFSTPSDLNQARLDDNQRQLNAAISRFRSRRDAVRGGGNVATDEMLAQLSKEMGEARARVAFLREANRWIEGYDAAHPDNKLGADELAKEYLKAEAKDLVVPAAWTREDLPPVIAAQQSADTYNEFLKESRATALDEVLDYIRGRSDLDPAAGAALVATLSNYSFKPDTATERVDGTVEGRDGRVTVREIKPRNDAMDSLFFPDIASAAIDGIREGDSPKEAYQKAVLRFTHNGKLRTGYRNEWVSYSDPKKMSDDLSLNCPGRWCVSSLGTAQGYMRDKGLFEIYYDGDGVPRVAIHHRNNEVMEISGSYSDQNLRDGEGDRAVAKLEEMKLEGGGDVMADVQRKALFDKGRASGEFDRSLIKVSETTGQLEFDTARRHTRYGRIPLFEPSDEDKANLNKMTAGMSGAEKLNLIRDLTPEIVSIEAKRLDLDTIYNRQLQGPSYDLKVKTTDGQTYTLTADVDDSNVEYYGTVPNWLQKLIVGEFNFKEEDADDRLSRYQEQDYDDEDDDVGYDEYDVGYDDDVETEVESVDFSFKQRRPEVFKQIAANTRDPELLQAIVAGAANGELEPSSLVGAAANTETVTDPVANRIIDATQALLKTAKVFSYYDVYDALAGNRNLSPETLRRVFDSKTVSTSGQISLAGNPNTPVNILRQLARTTVSYSDYSSSSIAKAIAANPSSEKATVEMLAQANTFIRTGVAAGSKDLEILTGLAADAAASVRNAVAENLRKNGIPAEWTSDDTTRIFEMLYRNAKGDDLIEFLSIPNLPAEILVDVYSKIENGTISEKSQEGIKILDQLSRQANAPDDVLIALLTGAKRERIVEAIASHARDEEVLKVALQSSGSKFTPLNADKRAQFRDAAISGIIRNPHASFGLLKKVIDIEIKDTWWADKVTDQDRPRYVATEIAALTRQTPNVEMIRYLAGTPEETGGQESYVLKREVARNVHTPPDLLEKLHAEAKRHEGNGDTSWEEISSAVEDNAKRRNLDIAFSTAVNPEDYGTLVEASKDGGKVFLVDKRTNERPGFIQFEVQGDEPTKTVRVSKTTLSSNLHGHGLGGMMYDRVVQWAGKKGLDMVSSGATSQSAGLVYIGMFLRRTAAEILNGNPGKLDQFADLASDLSPVNEDPAATLADMVQRTARYLDQIDPKATPRTATLDALSNEATGNQGKTFPMDQIPDVEILARVGGNPNYHPRDYYHSKDMVTPPFRIKTGRAVAENRPTMAAEAQALAETPPAPDTTPAEIDEMLQVVAEPGATAELMLSAGSRENEIKRAINSDENRRALFTARTKLAGLRLGLKKIDDEEDRKGQEAQIAELRRQVVGILDKAENAPSVVAAVDKAMTDLAFIRSAGPWLDSYDQTNPEASLDEAARAYVEQAEEEADGRVDMEILVKAAFDEGKLPPGATNADDYNRQVNDGRRDKMKGLLTYLNANNYGATTNAAIVATYAKSYFHYRTASEDINGNEVPEGISRYTIIPTSVHYGSIHNGAIIASTAAALKEGYPPKEAYQHGMERNLMGLAKQSQFKDQWETFAKDQAQEMASILAANCPGDWCITEPTKAYEYLTRESEDDAYFDEDEEERPRKGATFDIYFDGEGTPRVAIFTINGKVEEVSGSLEGQHLRPEESELAVERIAAEKFEGGDAVIEDAERRKLYEKGLHDGAFDRSLIAIDQTTGEVKFDTEARHDRYVRHEVFTPSEAALDLLKKQTAGWTAEDKLDHFWQSVEEISSVEKDGDGIIVRTERGGKPYREYRDNNWNVFENGTSDSIPMWATESLYDNGSAGVGFEKNNRFIKATDLVRNTKDPAIFRAAIEWRGGELKPAVASNSFLMTDEVALGMKKPAGELLANLLANPNVSEQTRDVLYDSMPKPTPMSLLRNMFYGYIHKKTFRGLKNPKISQRILNDVFKQLIVNDNPPLSQIEMLSAVAHLIDDPAILKRLAKHPTSYSGVSVAAMTNPAIDPDIVIGRLFDKDDDLIDEWKTVAEETRQPEVLQALFDYAVQLGRGQLRSKIVLAIAENPAKSADLERQMMDGTGFSEDLKLQVRRTVAKNTANPDLLDSIVDQGITPYMMYDVVQNANIRASTLQKIASAEGIPLSGRVETAYHPKAPGELVDQIIGEQIKDIEKFHRNAQITSSNKRKVISEMVRQLGNTDKLRDLVKQHAADPEILIAATGNRNIPADLLQEIAATARRYADNPPDDPAVADFVNYREYMTRAVQAAERNLPHAAQANLSLGATPEEISRALVGQMATVQFGVPTRITLPPGLVSLDEAMDRMILGSIDRDGRHGVAVYRKGGLVTVTPVGDPDDLGLRSGLSDIVFDLSRNNALVKGQAEKTVVTPAKPAREVRDKSGKLIKTIEAVAEQTRVLPAVSAAEKIAQLLVSRLGMNRPDGQTALETMRLSDEAKWTGLADELASREHQETIDLREILLWLEDQRVRPGYYETTTEGNRQIDYYDDIDNDGEDYVDDDDAANYRPYMIDHIGDDKGEYGSGYVEIVVTLPEYFGEYTSHHYSGEEGSGEAPQPGQSYAFHIRMINFRTKDGQMILHGGEVQSDRAADLRHQQSGPMPQEEIDELFKKLRETEAELEMLRHENRYRAAQQNKVAQPWYDMIFDVPESLKRLWTSSYVKVDNRGNVEVRPGAFDEDVTIEELDLLDRAIRLGNISSKDEYLGGIAKEDIPSFMSELSQRLIGQPITTANAKVWGYSDEKLDAEITRLTNDVLDLKTKLGGVQSTVGDFPFAKNYAEVAAKILLMRAVNGSMPGITRKGAPNYAYLTWTTGEQQIELYKSPNRQLYKDGIRWIVYDLDDPKLEVKASNEFVGNFNDKPTLLKEYSVFSDGQLMGGFTVPVYIDIDRTRILLIEADGSYDTTRMLRVMTPKGNNNFVINPLEQKYTFFRPQRVSESLRPGSGGNIEIEKLLADDDFRVRPEFAAAASGTTGKLKGPDGKEIDRIGGDFHLLMYNKLIPAAIEKLTGIKPTLIAQYGTHGFDPKLVGESWGIPITPEVAKRVKGFALLSIGTPEEVALPEPPPRFAAVPVSPAGLLRKLGLPDKVAEREEESITLLLTADSSAAPGGVIAPVGLDPGLAEALRDRDIPVISYDPLVPGTRTRATNNALGQLNRLGVLDEQAAIPGVTPAAETAKTQAEVMFSLGDLPQTDERIKRLDWLKNHIEKGLAAGKNVDDLIAEEEQIMFDLEAELSDEEGGDVESGGLESLREGQTVSLLRHDPEGEGITPLDQARVFFDEYVAFRRTGLNPQGFATTRFNDENNQPLTGRDLRARLIQWLRDPNSYEGTTPPPDLSRFSDAQIMAAMVDDRRTRLERNRRIKVSLDRKNAAAEQGTSGQTTLSIEAMLAKAVRDKLGSGATEVMFSTGGGSIDTAPFFSPIRKLIEKKMPNLATKTQVINMIKNAPGIKEVERNILGIEEWLEGLPEDKVSKQQVLDHIDQHKFRIEVIDAAERRHVYVVTDDNGNESIFDNESDAYAAQQGMIDIMLEAESEEVIREVNEGDWTIEQSQDGDWYIDGDNSPPEFFSSEEEAQEYVDDHIGKFYIVEYDRDRSDFFNTYAQASDAINEERREQLESEISLTELTKGGPEYSDWLYRRNKGKNPFEVLFRLVIPGQKKKSEEYTSGHFTDYSNIAVWVRGDIRIDSKGNRVLMIHEIQSDWAGDLRKKREQWIADQTGLKTPKGTLDKRAFKQLPAAEQKRLRAESQGKSARNEKVIADLKQQIAAKQAEINGIYVTEYQVHKSTSPIVSREYGVFQAGFDNEAAAQDFIQKNQDQSGVIFLKSFRNDKVVPEGKTEEHQRLTNELNDLKTKLNGAENAIGDMPYVDDYPELAVKYMLLMAANQGIVRLAWVTGDNVREIFESGAMQNVRSISWSKRKPTDSPVIQDLKRWLAEGTPDKVEQKVRRDWPFWEQVVGAGNTATQEQFHTLMDEHQVYSRYDNAKSLDEALSQEMDKLAKRREDWSIALAQHQAQLPNERIELEFYDESSSGVPILRMAFEDGIAVESSNQSQLRGKDLTSVVGKTIADQIEKSDDETGVLRNIIQMNKQELLSEMWGVFREKRDRVMNRLGRIDEEPDPARQRRFHDETEADLADLAKMSKDEVPVFEDALAKHREGKHREAFDMIQANHAKDGGAIRNMIDEARYSRMGEQDLRNELRRLGRSGVAIGGAFHQELYGSGLADDYGRIGTAVRKAAAPFGGVTIEQFEIDGQVHHGVELPPEMREKLTPDRITERLVERLEVHKKLYGSYRYLSHQELVGDYANPKTDYNPAAEKLEALVKRGMVEKLTDPEQLAELAKKGLVNGVVKDPEKGFYRATDKLKEIQPELAELRAPLAMFSLGSDQQQQVEDAFRRFAPLGGRSAKWRIVKNLPGNALYRRVEDMIEINGYILGENPDMIHEVVIHELTHRNIYDLAETPEGQEELAAIIAEASDLLRDPELLRGTGYRTIEELAADNGWSMTGPELDYELLALFSEKLAKTDRGRWRKLADQLLLWLNRNFGLRLTEGALLAWLSGKPISRLETERMMEVRRDADYLEANYTPEETTGPVVASTHRLYKAAQRIGDPAAAVFLSMNGKFLRMYGDDIIEQVQAVYKIKTGGRELNLNDPALIKEEIDAVASRYIKMVADEVFMRSLTGGSVDENVVGALVDHPNETVRQNRQSVLESAIQYLQNEYDTHRGSWTKPEMAAVLSLVARYHPTYVSETRTPDGKIVPAHAKADEITPNNDRTGVFNAAIAASIRDGLRDQAENKQREVLSAVNALDRAPGSMAQFWPGADLAIIDAVQAIRDYQTMGLPRKFGNLHALISEIDAAIEKEPALKELPAVGAYIKTVQWSKHYKDLKKKVNDIRQAPITTVIGEVADRSRSKLAEAYAAIETLVGENRDVQRAAKDAADAINALNPSDQREVLFFTKPSSRFDKDGAVIKIEPTIPSLEEMIADNPGLESLPEVAAYLVVRTTNHTATPLNQAVKLRERIRALTATPKDLYRDAVVEFSQTRTNAATNAWVQYTTGESEKLAEAVSGCPGGWCIAAETTAQHKLNDGDFHIYFDENGTATIAIHITRGKRQGEQQNVIEISGSLSGQHLKPGERVAALDKARELGATEHSTRAIETDAKTLEIYHKWTAAGSQIDPESMPAELVAIDRKGLSLNTKRAHNRYNSTPLFQPTQEQIEKFEDFNKSDQHRDLLKKIVRTKLGELDSTRRLEMASYAVHPAIQEVIFEDYKEGINNDDEWRLNALAKLAGNDRLSEGVQKAFVSLFESSAENNAKTVIYAFVKSQNVPLDLQERLLKRIENIDYRDGFRALANNPNTDRSVLDSIVDLLSDEELTVYDIIKNIQSIDTMSKILNRIEKMEPDKRFNYLERMVENRFITDEDFMEDLAMMILQLPEDNIGRGRFGADWKKSMVKALGYRGVPPKVMSKIIASAGLDDIYELVAADPANLNQDELQERLVKKIQAEGSTTPAAYGILKILAQSGDLSEGLETQRVLIEDLGTVDAAGWNARRRLMLSQRPILHPKIQERLLELMIEDMDGVLAPGLRVNETFNTHLTNLARNPSLKPELRSAIRDRLPKVIEARLLPFVRFEKSGWAWTIDPYEVGEDFRVESIRMMPDAVIPGAVEVMAKNPRTVRETVAMHQRLRKIMDEPTVGISTTKKELKKEAGKAMNNILNLSSPEALAEIAKTSPGGRDDVTAFLDHVYTWPRHKQDWTDLTERQAEAQARNPGVAVLAVDLLDAEDLEVSDLNALTQALRAEVPDDEPLNEAVRKLAKKLPGRVEANPGFYPRVSLIGTVPSPEANLSIASPEADLSTADSGDLSDADLMGLVKGGFIADFYCT